MTLALFPLFPNAAFFPALFFGIVIALVALVLGMRAPRSANAGTMSAWSLALGVIGLVTNLALIATIVVGVNFLKPTLNQVQIRAEGGASFTVEFADDTKSYVEEWQTEGWKQYTTTGSTAKITVTSPPGDHDVPVECTILWNGEVVVERSSPTGGVTCTYSE